MNEAYMDYEWLAREAEKITSGEGLGPDPMADAWRDWPAEEQAAYLSWCRESGIGPETFTARTLWVLGERRRRL